MRKIVVFATVFASMVLTVEAQKGKDSKPETLLRWSFAGTKQLQAGKEGKDAIMLREVLALAETAQFRDAAAQTIAMHAAKRFNRGGNTNSNPEIAKLIQPLIPDLLQNESRFVMNTKGADDADWMLAVKLEGNRLQDWSRSLAELAKATGMQGALPGAKSWTAQRDNYRIGYSSSKDWVVLEGGFGTADVKAGKDFRNGLDKRNAKKWLDAEINAPLLARIWGATNLAHAPKLTVTAEPRAKGVRSEVLIEYPEDLGIKPEKWEVPVELIREPLIGFNAIQGIEKKLASLPAFSSLSAKETPNQVFAWSLGNTPFSHSLAADVGNPEEVIRNAARAMEKTRLPFGSLVQPTNRAALVWDTTPLPIKPFIEQAPEPRSSYLTAGLFPLQYAANTNTIPAQLVGQLKKKNQVYYEWEISGARMQKWEPLWQSYHLLLKGTNPNNDAPSAKWIDALKTRLGNTVTEGVLENSRRIRLVRQSEIGFNGLELVLLAHMLDSNDIGIPRPAGGQQRPNARRRTPTVPPNAIPFTQPNSVPAPAPARP